MLRERLRRSQNEHLSRGAARWAISDKKTLDDFVKHLHYLIGDLEDMTEELLIPESQRYLAQYEIESITEPSLLELIEESRIDADDIVSDVASQHLSSIRVADNRSLHSTRQTVSSYDTSVGTSGSSSANRLILNEKSKVPVTLPSAEWNLAAAPTTHLGLRGFCSKQAETQAFTTF